MQYTSRIPKCFRSPQVDKCYKFYFLTFEIIPFHRIHMYGRVS